MKEEEIGKNMVDVHFTAIPREPYTAHEVQGKLYCPCVNDIVYERFELFCKLLNVVKVFVR